MALSLYSDSFQENNLTSNNLGHELAELEEQDIPTIKINKH